MACDCDNYINCNDKPIEVATYDENSSFGHEYENTTTSNDVLEFYQKTKRVLHVETAWDRDVNASHVVTGCESPLSCDGTSSAIPSSSCSEYCKMESNVPYFFDRQRGIYVWKHIEELLEFSIVSNKTAQFRMKWGTAKLHKICIPTSVKTKGKEQFVMVKDGVKTVLAEVDYQYNPFPVSDSNGGNWGLYGNVINNVTEPETSDVACILVFPTPPKLAMCQDADCLYYGFYDYNAVEGGFTENSLPRDDGGKDYFYPYWCRSMPTDPLWRSVADQRYEVIYSGGTMNLAGTSPWVPPEPTVYPWPFGSFALDSKANFIASCILQFGEHAAGKGVVYNEASMTDLFNAITKAGAPIVSKFTSVYPLAPL